MKRRTYFKGIHLIVMLALGAVGVCRAHRSDPLLLFAFDDPFPDTPFKNTLRICTQTWDLLEQLSISGNADRADCALLADAALGSCLRLQEALRVFVEYQSKDPSIVPVEDIIYLQVLVERVAHVQRSAGLQGDVDPLMKTILHETCQQCDQMVSAF